MDLGVGFGHRRRRPSMTGHVAKAAGLDLVDVGQLVLVDEPLARDQYRLDVVGGPRTNRQSTAVDLSAP
jgi:hypothetical protein